MSNSRNLSILANIKASPLILSTKFDHYGNSSFKKLQNFSSGIKNSPFLKEIKDNFFNSTTTFLTPYSITDIAPSSKRKDKNVFSFANISSHKTNAATSPNFKFSSNLFSIQNKQTAKRTLKLHKIKKYDKVTLSLNEISINGHRLLNFPLVDIGKEAEEVSLVKSLFTKGNKIKILDNNFVNLAIERSDNEEEYMLRNESVTVPISVMKANHIYFYANETNAKKIVLKFYSDIRDLLLLIEKNYINKKKKIYNQRNLLQLELLIRNCNDFSDFIKKKQKLRKVPHHSLIKINKDVINPTVEKKAVFKNTKKKKGFYGCPFCEKIFCNGQSLGGHMSQLHPNKSLNYKKKLEVRNSRKEQREIIHSAKRELLAQYGYDFNELRMNRNQELIRELIKTHQNEYRSILKKMKKNSHN